MNSESLEALRKYPELDPDNEAFNKELSEAVTESTLAYVKSNPTGSVLAHVSKLMKPYKKSLEKELGRETENLNKKVSEQALRPTTTVKTDKKFKDLTIKEMEEKLGFVY